MPYGVVYQITCSVNDKIYVGQTIKTLKERLNAHFYTAKYQPNRRNHFLRAIRKYGREAFSIKVLAEASNQQELDALEKQFIAELETVLRGYNSTSGGEHPVWSDKSRIRAASSQIAWRASAKQKKIMRLLAAGLEEDEILPLIVSQRKRGTDEESFLESDVYKEFCQELDECNDQLINGRGYQKTIADWELEEDLYRLSL